MEFWWKMFLTIFPQQKKLDNLLPNFAGSSPPISPKTSPTSLWKSLALSLLVFDQFLTTHRERWGDKCFAEFVCVTFRRPFASHGFRIAAESHDAMPLCPRGAPATLVKNKSEREPLKVFRSFSFNKRPVCGVPNLGPPAALWQLLRYNATKRTEF